jgi:hypothetical protein
MTIGFSIFLIAIGAILTFAVEFDVAGLNIAAVGWILMITGGVGVYLALRAPRLARQGTTDPEDEDDPVEDPFIH